MESPTAPVAIQAAPRNDTTYLCGCCGCHFVQYHLALDIFVLNPNGYITFEIDADKLADGRTWKQVLPQVGSTYGEFVEVIAAKLQENLNDAALRHLFNTYQPIPELNSYRLDIEFLH